MSFEKQVLFEVEAYETYETSDVNELRKVASHRVDLPEGFRYDPDFLYLWIRIISSGEYYGPNKNGDYFPTVELETYYQTFNEANVFKNHENKQIEKAIGKIFLVRWDPVMKCVEIFKGIDKKTAPEIARGFIKGYMSDVSMGCKVPFTVCSICGNKARKVTEFCRHIKNHRMEFLDNGERVFEINYEPKFHDSSVVLSGAERVAKALYIMDQPIQDGNTIIRSFRKAANTVTLCEQELEKIAHHNTTHIHPLLQEPTMNKVASDNYFLQKSAELEKEVTGKLLNILTSPGDCFDETSQHLIQIIKFLTEKRMDEKTLSSIAQNLTVISTKEKMPITKVFTSFLAVAEMLGIELFPTELHTLLCQLTHAKLEDALQLSDNVKTEALPSDFTKGVQFTNDLLQNVPEFDDPSELLNTYEEATFNLNDLHEQPGLFFEKMKSAHKELDEPVPIRVIRIFKDTLSPFQPIRSRHSEFLLPRLSLVLSGHQSIVGDSDVARDVQLLANPQTLGDVLASLTYGNYSKMRPDIQQSILIKHAEQEEKLFEKKAYTENMPKYKGLSRRKLLVTAVPAIYGASAFQKVRESREKPLSDMEEFVKSRPDVITGGVLLSGPMISRGVYNTARDSPFITRYGLKVARKGVDAAKDGVKQSLKAAKKGAKVAVEGVEEVKQGVREVKQETLAARAAARKAQKEAEKNNLNKLTSEECVGLVKLADSLPHGNYNVFSKDTLKKFARDYGLDGEYVAALKLATLYDIGGLEKEATAIAKQYEIGYFEKAAFLRVLGNEVETELEKAASDFAKMTLIETLGNPTVPMSTSIPGRLVDAFVVNRLQKLLEPKAQENPSVANLPNIPKVGEQ